ncbi:MAG: general stress protein B [Armatimonadetes bacterium]|nr:general stress protein B [Armatimonadota bacterium]
MAKPGPAAGSEGARKIAEAHRGSHEHDKEGGFAANPSLAREAGRKGGETVKNRYGPTFYQSIGKKGGETVKRERGTEFYAEIGRKGGEMRGQRAATRREGSAADTSTSSAPTGRKRGRPAKKSE